MDRTAHRKLAIVAAIVVAAIASAVLAAGYIASQQPASLAKTLRKKVLADQACYERTARTAIKVARVRQGELELDDLPSSDRWMANDAKVDGIMTSVPLPGRAGSMPGRGRGDVLAGDGPAGSRAGSCGVGRLNEGM